MPSVILQPCADRLAKKHFYTITEGASLASIKKFLDQPTYRKLKSFYPDSKIPVWGVQEKKGQNVENWNRIKPGDVAYFYRDWQLIARGVITMPLQNARLASHLWGNNADGSTWEYMYFLQAIKQTQIPIDGLNEILGHTPTYPVRSFTVLEGESNRLALEYLEFIVPGGEKPEGINRAKLVERLKKLETTDKPTATKARMEQDLLKRILLGKKQYSKCAICGVEFPVSFLVAAHIKQRSQCSLNERTNPDVVMPLCRMGCDHLYEYGYLSVFRGKVVALRRSPMTAFIRNYVANVVGKDCRYYGENNRIFFEEHYDFNADLKNNPLLKKYHHE